MHTIQYKTIKRDVFTDNPSDHIQKYWYDGSFYEAHRRKNNTGILTYIYDHYRGGAIIDAGACIGNHSLFFSELFERVFSFEPQKENFSLLLKNIRVNKLFNVFPFPIALSEKAGLCSMKRLQDDNCGMYEIAEGKEIIVNTIDNIFGNEKIDFIKIDVEGHGEKIVKGAERIIKKYHPVIFIEGESELLKNWGYAKLEQSFNHTPTYIYQWET